MSEERGDDATGLAATASAAVSFSLRVSSPAACTVSTACARYLLQIAGSGLCVEEKDMNDVGVVPAIIDRTKGKAVACRLSEVMNWLSSSKHHAGGASAEMMSLCGGSDVFDRRKVARGIKRVLAWESDWNESSRCLEH